MLHLKALVLIILLFWVSTVSAQVQLQYQNRGNRHEGIKPKPVSGYDIELISVLVDYQEEIKQLPEWLKIRFFLKEQSKVYLTVRELDYQHYYWLDKVHPSEPWKPGFNNVFQWPTNDVLQRLDHIGMYDLGIVARLNRAQPSDVELVTPVIFYHSKPPAVIKGYLFTFKTNGDARLTWSIFMQGETEPLLSRTFRGLRHGRPFTVKWDSLRARSGSYKLTLSGFFLDTNDRVAKTVFFYHQPVVK